MAPRIAQMFLFLFLANCPRPVIAADPVRAVLTPRSERPAAPAISVKDRAGKSISLISYRGNVILVDFWATWCGGCKQELPWFQEFETTYRRRKFAVVAVSMDEGGWPIVTPFVESLKLAFKVALDDGETSKRYELKEMPAAFLIDRDGRLAAKYVGMADRDNLDANIRALLSERHQSTGSGRARRSPPPPLNRQSAIK